MNEINELLILIQNISWLFYMAAMLMFYYITKQSTNRNSSLITMIIAVSIQALIIGYEEILLAHIEANPGYNPILNFSWYIGFSILEIVGIWTIILIHKKENVRIGTLGQFIVASFFIRCSIQLLQYGEIILYKSDQAIWNIYMIGLPTINISIAVASFGLACVAIYHLNFHENGLKGLKRWTI